MDECFDYYSFLNKKLCYSAYFEFVSSEKSKQIESDFWYTLEIQKKNWVYCNIPTPIH